MNESKAFAKHTGKETTLSIVRETKIGSGDFGDVFDCTVKIGNKEKKLVRKKYRQGLNNKSASENVETAFKNYTMMKEAKLKVFPTFRKDDKENSILMTSGLSEDQILLPCNSETTVEQLGRQPILEIENFENFLSEIFSESIKAIRAGIQLHGDAFFFTISKADPAKIDFILGDLDNVVKSLEDVAILSKRNLMTTYWTLYHFIRQNVSNKDIKRILLTQLESYYRDVCLKVLDTYPKDMEGITTVR